MTFVVVTDPGCNVWSHILEVAAVNEVLPTCGRHWCGVVELMECGCTLRVLPLSEVIASGERGTGTGNGQEGAPASSRPSGLT